MSAATFATPNGIDGLGSIANVLAESCLVSTSLLSARHPSQSLGTCNVLKNSVRMPASVLYRFSSLTTLHSNSRRHRSRSSVSTPYPLSTAPPTVALSAPSEDPISHEHQAPWHSTDNGRRRKRPRVSRGEGGYIGMTKVVLITIGWVLITGMVMGTSQVPSVLTVGLTWRSERKRRT